MRRLAYGTAALLLFSSSTPAAIITALSSSGAGGTTTLAIENAGQRAAFTATFTANAPIDIHFTVDGPGNYSLAPPGGSVSVPNIFNAAGARMTALDFDLVGAPAGSQLNLLQSSNLPPDFFSHLAFKPLFTGGTFSGPPGISPGGDTGLRVDFQIAGSPTVAEPIDFIVRLTPTFAPPVPEPATLVSLGIAALTAGAWRLRRRLM